MLIFVALLLLHCQKFHLWSNILMCKSCLIAGGGHIFKSRANSYTTTHHHHPWYWKWLIGDHHDTRHYYPPVYVLHNVEEFVLIDNYMFATRNVSSIKVFYDIYSYLMQEVVFFSFTNFCCDFIFSELWEPYS